MSSFTPDPTLCKLLFGRANRCAYPGCKRPLIVRHRGELSVNVEIAHIRSGRRKGPRYDSSWPSTDVNVESNLLLLCREHHKWVDDHPHRYPVDELLNWKQTQIAQDDGIELDDVQVTQILHSLNGPLVYLPYRTQELFVGRECELERLETDL